MNELTDVCEENAGWIFPVPATPTGCDTAYHDEIVAILTADGAPSLEGLATVTRAVDCTLISIVLDVGGSPEAQLWKLNAGTADPLDAGQVEPSDFNGVTNAKFWEKVG